MKNYITFSLVFLNIVVFIYYTITGELLYNMGSLSVTDIMERGEYYRIIASLFLHADLQHIFSNMLFLAALGDMLEGAIGHLRFAAVYLLAGIGGNLCSMLYELIGSVYYHTVGASGAVFGLIGALLWLLIRNNGVYGQVSLRRMLLALFYLFYSGAQSAAVNQAAHAGGLVTGFGVMAAFYLRDHNNRKRYRGDWG